MVYWVPIKSRMAEQASRRRCLTSIKVRIVSGLRLARCSDMVSHPPENILSTATADPVNKVSKLWTRLTIDYDSPRIERISRANWDKLGNWAQQPAHHWSGLHESKFSRGRLKYAWTSSVRGCATLWYRDVKSTFWGEPEGATEGSGVAADKFGVV